MWLVEVTAPPLPCSHVADATVEEDVGAFHLDVVG